MRIKFIHHASFVIISDITIYIDPYKIDPIHNHKADYILITHDHYDHYNEEDIKKISTSKTKVIVPEYMKNKNEKYISISTHDTIELENLKLSTIPAYNINKPFHNKNQGVGYIFQIQENNKTYTIYHAGDTDFTEEMSKMKGIDYALIPIGGTYTMNEEQAIKFIEFTKPKNVIPMHFGNTVGIELENNTENLEKICKKNNIKLIKLKINEFIDEF